MRFFSSYKLNECIFLFVTLDTKALTYPISIKVLFNWNIRATSPSWYLTCCQRDTNNEKYCGNQVVLHVKVVAGSNLVNKTCLVMRYLGYIYTNDDNCLLHVADLLLGEIIVLFLVNKQNDMLINC